MSVEFIAVVLVVVAAPGPDFVVTLRNTVTGGPSAGTATALGISAASAVQGTLVSLGLGAVVVQSQVVFTTLTWLGIGYLAFLAAQALRCAWIGSYDRPSPQVASGRRGKGFRQGFLTNITNPKMFVFYLSLLPQFVGSAAPVWQWLAHAWVLPLVGSAWLIGIVVLAGAVREKLLRPAARRVMDATSGLALLGFSAGLAVERD